MTRHRSNLAAAAIVLIVVSTLLLTTRLGVWVFLDLLGSLDEQPLPLDASAGPVSSPPFAGPIASLEMPPGIEQPSGITFDPQTRTWAISTDQAELFVLDESMTRVLSRRLLLRTPPLFRQGQIEAVAFVPGARTADDRLAFIGEIGKIQMWRRLAGDSPEWESAASISLPGELAELEASALAFDPSAGKFFIASTDSSILYLVNPNGSIARRLDLEASDRWPPGALEPGRRVDELRISGLSLADGYLWAVTENYTTLLQLDPRSGNVVGLQSLPKLGEASDLALVEGKAVFTLDHNWNDPRPTFRRIDLLTGSG
ncbi:MAG: hypothetical protein AAF560_11760 [Acidobacteriota bacterium]